MPNAHRFFFFRVVESTVCSRRSHHKKGEEMRWSRWRQRRNKQELRTRNREEVSLICRIRENSITIKRSQVAFTVQGNRLISLPAGRKAVGSSKTTGFTFAVQLRC